MLWLHLRRLRSSNPRRWIRGAEACGRLRDPRAVEPLMRVLHYTDASAAPAAANALASIGTPDAIGALERVLDAKETRHAVRTAVAQALESAGWKPSSEHLDGWRAVMLDDWQGAIALGRAAVAPLLAVRRDGGPERRERIDEALRAIGAAAVEDLIAFAHKDSSVLPILAAIADPRCVRELLLIRSDSPSRVAVPKSLSIPLLVEALADPSPRLRKRAADVLRDFGWSPTTDAERVSVLIADRRWGSLPAFGSSAVEPLVRLLPHEDFAGAAEIAALLGAIGDPRAAGPLAALLEREDGTYREWGSNDRPVPHEAVHRAAIAALVRIGTADAVRLLLRAFRSRYASKIIDGGGFEVGYAVRVRAMILEALESSVGPYAVAPLLEVFTDRETYAWLWEARGGDTWTLVDAAIVALGRLGCREAADALLEAWAKEEHASWSFSVADTLAKFGEVRAVPLLVRVLQSRGLYEHPWHSRPFERMRDALAAILRVGAARIPDEQLQTISRFEDELLMWSGCGDWGPGGEQAYDFSPVRDPARRELERRGSSTAL